MDTAGHSMLTRAGRLTWPATDTAVAMEDAMGEEEMEAAVVAAAAMEEEEEVVVKMVVAW